ncbi:transposase [Paraburkholderia youngii]|uniref:transposase n=2 Tax=Paraburkholderia TaxID=1822464 RepID=UPI0035D4C7B5
MSNRADLPDDVELLKALLVEARSLLAERDVEIEQLKAQIDKLRRMQFGRKSEQLQRQIETLETQLEVWPPGAALWMCGVRRPAVQMRPSQMRRRTKRLPGKRFPRICRARIMC